MGKEVLFCHKQRLHTDAHTDGRSHACTEALLTQSFLQLLITDKKDCIFLDLNLSDHTIVTGQASTIPGASGWTLVIFVLFRSSTIHQYICILKYDIPNHSHSALYRRCYKCCRTLLEFCHILKKFCRNLILSPRYRNLSHIISSSH